LQNYSAIILHPLYIDFACEHECKTNNIELSNKIFIFLSLKLVYNIMIAK